MLFRSLKAIVAEGVRLTKYIPHGLHKEPWTKNLMDQKIYQKMFTPARLQKFSNELVFPNCDNILDNIVMIWASGPLTGTKEDMDDVYNAIMKVYDNRDKLNSI